MRKRYKWNLEKAHPIFQFVVLLAGGIIGYNVFRWSIILMWALFGG